MLRAIPCARTTFAGGPEVSPFIFYNIFFADIHYYYFQRLCFNGPAIYAADRRMGAVLQKIRKKNKKVLLLFLGAGMNPFRVANKPIPGRIAKSGTKAFGRFLYRANADFSGPHVAPDPGRVEPSLRA